MSDWPDADDNSRKCFDLAISSLRERLEKSRVVIGDCDGVPVCFTNNHDTVSIYAICLSGSAIPVYVGSTKRQLKDRIRAHIQEAKKGRGLPINSWIRKNLAGFDVILLEFTNAASRHLQERYWAEKFKSTILNVTDGGAGLSGHKFAGTTHAKRIGEARKRGGYFNCEVCSRRFWRKPSEIAEGHNKFCSRVCSNTRARGRAEHA